jgi:hypothetical protein
MLAGVFEINGRYETDMVDRHLVESVLATAALSDLWWTNLPAPHRQPEPFSVSVNSAEPIPDESFERKRKNER